MRTIQNAFYYLKVIFVLFLFLFFLYHTEMVLALNLFDPLKTDPSVTPLQNIASLIGTILGQIYNMVVGLAMIFIVLGGMMYLFSGGTEQRVTSAKKMIVFALMGLAIAIGSAIILKEVATALGVTNLFGDTFIHTITNVDLVKTISAGTLLENIILVLLTSLAMLGIIGIVVGGIWYLTSGGNEDRATLGKKTIIYAVVGLTISIGSMIIVKQLETLFK